ncbi:hypothetical protein V8E54_003122 [Elaphomyces granulatus]
MGPPPRPMQNMELPSRPIQMEDESEFIAHMHFHDPNMSQLEMALGIFADNTGMSRTEWAALRQILTLVDHPMIQRLPHSLTTLKRHLSRELKYEFESTYAMDSVLRNHGEFAREPPRSRDVIEIEDAPSRSSISTTNQIAPRFGSYNRQGAETLRQSQPLRHNSIRRGSLGGLTTDRSPTAYPAVVSFYMLHYQLSEEEDSEMIAEAISAQLLRTMERTGIRVPSRTIDSIEDFITTDLLPDVSRPGRYVRRQTDRLRLATAVNKLEPVYISQNADRRQATDDLLKNWFHTSGHRAGGQWPA